LTLSRSCSQPKAIVTSCDSEQFAASAIVNLLNHYFFAVTGLIRGSNGVVDKYMGDDIVAFWALPFSIATPMPAPPVSALKDQFGDGMATASIRCRAG